MAHHSRLTMIVIDAPPEQHDAELAFWQGATGRQLTSAEKHPEYHGARLHEHLGLLVQHLGDGPARVHLDIHTDDLAAEVARLEALGAEQVGEAHAWRIMRDPAGLIFCVVPETGGTMDAANAQRWD